MGSLAFYKMSGGGNDFIVADNRQKTLVLETAQIADLCRRGMSVGADGLILLEPSQRADFKMRHYNADGRESTFCGNGLRCIARFALLRVIAPRTMHIETACGVKKATVQNDRVSVEMEPPSHSESGVSLLLDGLGITGHYTQAGVPHFVVFTDNIDTYPVEITGSKIRHHDRFSPEGVNVNFVKHIDESLIQIRTFERGVERETLSCGTGCVAASWFAHLQFGEVRTMRCRTQSGVTLDVTAEEDFKHVSLTGDARVVYQGDLWEEAISRSPYQELTSGGLET